MSGAVTPFDPVVVDERHGSVRVKPHVKRLLEKDREEACPQRTEVWYQKRRNHLTASQIASAVGENPYENRMTAIRKKIGLEQGFTGNAATEHGNRYESVAIELYEKKTGEKVLEFGLLESIKEKHVDPESKELVDVDTSFLAGSPDGITASCRLIEVKCPFRRKPNGTIPSHYVHQVQTLMHILDIPVCDFIEYVPNGTWTEEVFQIVTVERCDDFWNRNFPKLERFWNEVLELRGEIVNKGIDHVDDKTKLPPKRKRQRRAPAPPTCEITILSEDVDQIQEEEVYYDDDLAWPMTSEFLNALAELITVEDID